MDIMYSRPYKGYSVTGNEVEIVGERFETGKEYYLYNIVGYQPQNGQPFVALKCNVHPIETIPETEVEDDIDV